MRRQDQHSHSQSARHSRQRGSILLYLILGLAAFGVLAAAGANRFGASARSVLQPNCAVQARYMAESGVRFAAAYLKAATTQADLTARIAYLNAQSPYTVDATRGLQFALTVTANGAGNALVSSTGSSCGSIIPTSYSSSGNAVNVPSVPGGGGEVTSQSIASDNYTTTDLQGNSPISVDPVTGAITFGKLTQTQNAAALWYGGNATGGCLNGNCTMDYGLRAAFDILWTPGSAADGLVFGILSAETNLISAVGGEASMGELMGWGGRGTSGVGIRPPKLGLEFDTYYNACGGTLNVAGSRCDDSNQWDHMAYVFWGTQLDTTYGPTFDDNRHGAGAGNASEPISLANPDGLGSGRFGYYYSNTASNWLKGNGTTSTKYGIRYELSRIGTKNAEGNYPYVIKTWVQVGAGASPFNDVTQNYTALAPTMQRVVHLTPTLHSQLGHVFFGWTEATGASTQELTVSAFKLAFKANAETLTPPTDYVSYWNMNAGSGVVVADSNATNHNTGTITGTVNWVTPANYSYSKALSFSGDAGRVSVPDSSSLDLTTQGTFSVWIYPTTVGTASDGTFILHKGAAATTSDEAYSLGFSTGGKLALTLRYGSNAGNYITLESTALPAANRWYHVAAQWDNGVLVFYVNGMVNSIATNPNTRAARNTTGALVIGARHTAGAGPYYGFNGYIDELRIYNRVLTAEEIAALSLMP